MFITSLLIGSYQLPIWNHFTLAASQLKAATTSVAASNLCVHFLNEHYLLCRSSSQIGQADPFFRT
jgi:hypothetical protein